MAFATERLNVFVFRCKPNRLHAHRTVFTAMFREIDWPGQVAVATVWTAAADVMGGRYVDWIEVSEPHRRQGLAAELWRGIESYLGASLKADGVGEAGKALCASMESA